MAEPTARALKWGRSPRQAVDHTATSEAHGTEAQRARAPLSAQLTALLTSEVQAVATFQHCPVAPRCDRPSCQHRLWLFCLAHLQAGLCSCVFAGLALSRKYTIMGGGILTSTKSARAGMYPAMSLESKESKVGRGGSSAAGKRKVLSHCRARAASDANCSVCWLVLLLCKRSGDRWRKNDWGFMKGYGQEKPESIQRKRQESEICRVLSKVKQKFKAINRL